MKNNNILVLLAFLVICLVNLTAQSPSHPAAKAPSSSPVENEASSPLKMATTPAKTTRSDSTPVEEKLAERSDSSGAGR